MGVFWLREDGGKSGGSGSGRGGGASGVLPLPPCLSSTKHISLPGYQPTGGQRKEVAKWNKVLYSVLPLAVPVLQGTPPVLPGLHISKSLADSAG